MKNLHRSNVQYWHIILFTPEVSTQGICHSTSSSPKRSHFPRWPWEAILRDQKRSIRAVQTALSATVSVKDAVLYPPLNLFICFCTNKNVTQEKRENTTVKLEPLMVTLSYLHYRVRMQGRQYNEDVLEKNIYSRASLCSCWTNLWMRLMLLWSVYVNTGKYIESCLPFLQTEHEKDRNSGYKALMYPFFCTVLQFYHQWMVQEK